MKPSIPPFIAAAYLAVAACAPADRDREDNAVDGLVGTVEDARRVEDLAQTHKEGIDAELEAVEDPDRDERP